MGLGVARKVLLMSCIAYVSPEIAKDSEEMLKAMKETERDWPRAMDKIAERVSLPDTRRNPPWGMYSKSPLPHRR